MTAAQTTGTAIGASPPTTQGKPVRAWTPVPSLHGSFFLLLFVAGVLAFGTPLGLKFGTEQLRSTEQTAEKLNPANR